MDEMETVVMRNCEIAESFIFLAEQHAKIGLFKGLQLLPPPSCHGPTTKKHLVFCISSLTLLLDLKLNYTNRSFITDGRSVNKPGSRIWERKVIIYINFDMIKDQLCFLKGKQKDKKSRA